MNMRKIIAVVIMMMTFVGLHAQERVVQNRPYTDLRPLHFGVVVGTHVQDLELTLAQPITITNEDGTTETAIVSADQDRWDMGFNVGVLGELRLNTHFQFRFAPTMYFGTRHLTYRKLNALDDTAPLQQTQELKTVYIASAFDLIFAAPRFNNHRPYLMAGLTPTINLSGKTGDILKLKRYGMFAEMGIGCDFYLPFFKLRPELKFMYGLGNSIDKNHAKEMRDKNLKVYTNALKEAHTKMIVLSFYFE